jgi:hypothetical protein
VYHTNVAISAATAAASAYNNFIARVTGASAGLKSAYQGLLDGLTTDGLFNGDGTSSYFDVLYIFATQDTATALLNLVSSSFTGTAHGSPTFSANNGYTGADNSTTIYIDSGFNPTSGSPKYTQNSAHLSVWGRNDFTTVSGGIAMGTSDNVIVSHIYPRFSDGVSYLRCNENGGVAAAVPNSVGHYVASRTAATTFTGYKNASSLGTSAVASGALANENFFVLAYNDFGSPDQGYGGRVGAASLGAGLSATQVTNFYNRLVTFMAAADLGFP